MTFPTFTQSKDPSDVMDYTFPFLLSTGEALAATPTVVVVDSTDTPIAATDLVISNLTYGLITGQQYGVTVYVSAGSPQTYLLRCRVTTTASPARTFDRTVQLICEHR